ncbi:MAG: hypothetical protein R3Y56_02315 [Akkermansia sp.]
MSLPPSPRITGAQRIIQRLLDTTVLAPYVFDAPFFGGDQVASLRAIAAANDGLIVVVPQDLSSSALSKADDNIRDGWMSCDYLVSCFCTRLAHGGTDNELFTDQLLTATLASLVTLDPDNPTFKPQIQGDSEIALELGEKEYLAGRTLRLSLKLAYNLASIN